MSGKWKMWHKSSCKVTRKYFKNYFKPVTTFYSIKISQILNIKQKIAIQGLKNQLNIQEHSQHYLTYNIKSLKKNNRRQFYHAMAQYPWTCTQTISKTVITLMWPCKSSFSLPPVIFMHFDWPSPYFKLQTFFIAVF